MSYSDEKLVLTSWNDLLMMMTMKHLLNGCLWSFDPVQLPPDDADHDSDSDYAELIILITLIRSECVALSPPGTTL